MVRRSKVVVDNVTVLGCLCSVQTGTWVIIESELKASWYGIGATEDLAQKSIDTVPNPLGHEEVDYWITGGIEEANEMEKEEDEEEVSIRKIIKEQSYCVGDVPRWPGDDVDDGHDNNHFRHLKE